MKRKPKPEVTEATAETVLGHYFDGAAKGVARVHGGLANHVFEASVHGKNLIVRISEDPARLPFFMKEQWAVRKVRERKVPVPEILEVGNEIDGTPYMIMEKVTGAPASDQSSRCGILRELAAIAREINSLKTSDFGHVFDWSRNRLSRNRTWPEYLASELKTDETLELFRKEKVLTRANMAKLRKAVDELRKVKAAPSLNHGDIRLKNVILNPDGKIMAIIDWENCTSNLAPFWELSIALHDLNMDEQEAFLEGYGMSPAEFSEALPHIRTLNQLNYAQAVRQARQEKDPARFEWLAARLNGSMNLF